MIFAKACHTVRMILIAVSYPAELVVRSDMLLWLYFYYRMISNNFDVKVYFIFTVDMSVILRVLYRISLLLRTVYRYSMVVILTCLLS
jgi:hypothetical protein